MQRRHISESVVINQEMKTLTIILLLLAFQVSNAQECQNSLNSTERIRSIEEELRNVNLPGFDTTNYYSIINNAVELWDLGFEECSLTYFERSSKLVKSYIYDYGSDYPKGICPEWFKKNYKIARKLLSNITYKVSIFGYSESLNKEDFEAARRFTSYGLYFTPFEIKDCRSYWKEIELITAQKQFEDNIYKLIKYHWRYLKSDSSRIKKRKFEGYDYLVKKINEEFTKESYSEFLENIIEVSYLKSKNQYSTILETRIGKEFITFYNRDLSCRFSLPNICCDTVVGYFHEEPRPWAETIKINCDTITNILNPSSDFELYRNHARNSSLFWLINEIND